MSVSRALRFQILRRDGHACQYCGGKPPDVSLEVDHVLPVTLGGTDTPDNLITSCKDCNAGKGATPPDAPTVQAVDDNNREWAAAIELAARNQAKQANRHDWFRKYWDSYTIGFQGNHVPLAADWRNSLDVWLDRGLPQDRIIELVDVAMGASVPPRAVFRYFAGCCWNAVRELESEAQQIIDNRWE